MTNNVNAQPPTTAPKKRSPWVWILLGCGVIVVVGGLVTAGVLWWGYHKAKNFVEKETGGDAMKVAELWPDVPRMDGMSSAQQIDMPIGLKIVAKTMMDTMMRGLNDGKSAGHWDWTAFSVGDKKPSDVEAFYTTDRMKPSGWEQQGGCATMPANMSSEPTFCSFQKHEGDKTTGLLIIAAADEENKATSLFFIRQEIQGGSNP